MSLAVLETSSLLFRPRNDKLLRLLWYSIFGWYMLPIFLIHETTTYSTTEVLDLRMGHASYLFRP